MKTLVRVLCSCCQTRLFVLWSNINGSRIFCARVFRVHGQYDSLINTNLKRKYTLQNFTITLCFLCPPLSIDSTSFTDIAKKKNQPRLHLCRQIHSTINFSELFAWSVSSLQACSYERDYAKGQDFPMTCYLFVATGHCIFSHTTDKT